MKEFFFHNFICKKRGYFEGVCLELDIVVDGNTPEDAKKTLDELILGHMRLAAEEGFPKCLTHRPAPQRYWNKFYALLEILKTPQKHKTPSFIVSELLRYNPAQNQVNFAYA